jgi:hypothetical protein
MHLPRPGQIRREAFDFGRVYLIVIVAMLLGLLFKGVIRDIATLYPVAEAPLVSGPFEDTR